MEDTDALGQLCERARADRCDAVERGAISLLQSHAARRCPLLLPNAVGHWPACRLWDHDYLRKAMAGRTVHVARTPNGLADALTTLADGSHCFARPCEAAVPFEDFLDALAVPMEARDPRIVHYASHQASSLSAEYDPLLADCASSLEFADTALGGEPVAANVWIGEDAARTQVHADLFCNIYAVVRGTKRFTLLPPQDVALLKRKSVPTASWVDVGGGVLELRLDDPALHVHWASVDLGRELPRLEQAVEVTVSAGDVLYLPALWHHAVEQHAGAEASTVAVNYWYDRG